MSSRKSKRVCFSPYANEKPIIFLKHGEGGYKKRIIKKEPVRFLLQLGAKVASAIRDVSFRSRSSRKVSSSTLLRSYSLSHSTDSHRAEAVEDCIMFLHSSSSRERPSFS
ncbi:hypothetical protein Lal_00041903 [Lupinus albus]|uniref:Uncharacterized protein n=1 Tax=Lupinus albus TaxID=3870 RepID=A0A6A5PF14_LUPAL|nr:hypothetical protein Lalb_Chr03g0043081 [Lupinus albus]KAF1895622.1 hypothetical protein Lal_00041903 [Lupinus albus]